MPDTLHHPARVPVHVDLHSVPLNMWQTLRAARRNLLDIIPRQTTEETIISGKTGRPWHMIMDPDAIRRVVLEELGAYPKSDITKVLFRPAVGESLFIAEGDHWRWQRRTTAPVFTHRNMMNLSPIMTRAAEAAADRVAGAGKRAVNMADEMVRTTLDVISDVTFSGDDALDRASIQQAVDAYIETMGKIALFDVLDFPEWIPRPERMFAGPVVTRMRTLADDAIAARRSAPRQEMPDLLDLMMAGEDPKTARKMTNAELRDNLLTFIVAGHETTALTLAWALYLCAFDQDVQAKAREEARAVLDGRAATGEDVARLPYCRMIIDEALRLYPPGAIVSRTAQKRDELCGTPVNPGDTVMIPIYSLHRHRDLWEAPDAFVPERFADRKAVPRFTYFPFIDGPRVCIGAQFALTEAVIILSTLLSRFNFTQVPGRDPEPVMIMTLRPEGGVWLEAEAID